MKPHCLEVLMMILLCIFVFGSQGEITVSGGLDREEEKGQFALTIEARDNNGAPEAEQRVTPGYMTVILTDVNDFVPR